ncbi:hypothetical protein FKM82_003861 [Ascaphus truei]
MSWSNWCSYSSYAAARKVRGHLEHHAGGIFHSIPPKAPHHTGGSRHPGAPALPLAGEAGNFSRCSLQGCSNVTWHLQPGGGSLISAGSPDPLLLLTQQGRSQGLCVRVGGSQGE